MPELPDISIYIEALRRRVVPSVVNRITVRSPFLLRSVEPPIDAAQGRPVVGVSRLGKRIVIELEGDLFVVIHLMIAGRLRWMDGAAAPRGKIDLASFVFESDPRRGEPAPASPLPGTLLLTEAGTKKRASLHVLAGRAALAAHDPGGIDVLTCSADEFAAALQRENRTVKRALTNPRLFSGIGNAFSDEILHAARMSPFRLTGAMSNEDAAVLHAACRNILERWTERLMREFRLDGEGPGKFPGAGQVTAFRPDFAVHGRFRQPCPVCGHAVQRIVYAENEMNYCAECQCGGKVLADRSLSRLLRDDWPRTIEEWEAGA